MFVHTSPPTSAFPSAHASRNARPSPCSVHACLYVCVSFERRAMAHLRCACPSIAHNRRVPLPPDAHPCTPPLTDHIQSPSSPAPCQIFSVAPRVPRTRRRVCLRTKACLSMHIPARAVLGVTRSDMTWDHGCCTHPPTSAPSPSGAPAPGRDTAGFRTRPDQLRVDRPEAVQPGRRVVAKSR
ncbi:hypothetical protein C8Q73DRAFT_718330 [Cubamyces lactineus]|nr:hypothetical protein C8Q73DRAFT_718330 [Cubamyces lactineus]